MPETAQTVDLARPSSIAEPHDLIVVGGGVYGTCVALESARRGLRPLLLERDEFGKATSANTSRILHGGLRYLQSLDLGRFNESVRERSWFMRQFPDLVAPLKFVMPLYGQGLKRRSVMRVALGLNDLLSRHRNEGLSTENRLPDGRLIGRQETIDLFPDVRRQGLQGSACWYDAVMLDPQRIIEELVQAAQRLGATCADHFEASRLLVADGEVSGIEAVDRKAGKTIALSAATVVNCGGPWSRGLAASFDRDLPQLFRPSLAFNLLLDRAPISTHAVAVSAGSRPMRFLLPREQGILAGTWHEPWNGTCLQPQPSESQIEDFLSELNEAVPSLKLSRRDVRRVDAGLLPAATEGSSRTANRPVIHDHGRDGGPQGLYSVSGVKFTTARAVAERTVAALHSASSLVAQS